MADGKAAEAGQAGQGGRGVAEACDQVREERIYDELHPRRDADLTRCGRSATDGWMAPCDGCGMGRRTAVHMEKRARGSALGRACPRGGRPPRRDTARPSPSRRSPALSARTPLGRPAGARSVRSFDRSILRSSGCLLVVPAFVRSYIRLLFDCCFSLIHRSSALKRRAAAHARSRSHACVRACFGSSSHESVSGTPYCAHELYGLGLGLRGVASDRRFQESAAIRRDQLPPCNT